MVMLTSATTVTWYVINGYENSPSQFKINAGKLFRHVYHIFCRLTGNFIINMSTCHLVSEVPTRAVTYTITKSLSGQASTAIQPNTSRIHSAALLPEPTFTLDNSLKLIPSNYTNVTLSAPSLRHPWQPTPPTECTHDLYRFSAFVF